MRGMLMHHDPNPAVRMYDACNVSQVGMSRDIHMNESWHKCECEL